MRCRSFSSRSSQSCPTSCASSWPSAPSGNPFFLEELVGELVDRGVLVQTADGWDVGRPDAELAMPDTVHAVLAARIDRLPATEKAALQAGAVMGRVFSAAPVVHLLGGEAPDFGLLEERDLVVAGRSPLASEDHEFAIKHALTREVAYSSIPKARRGRLHAELADWLEQAGSDERAPVLAYHYAEAAKVEHADLVWAGDPGELDRVRRRAVHWLSRAGRLARGRNEMDEAVELLYARRRAERRRARTRPTLARDRRCAGAALRRRGLLGCDGSGARRTADT